VDAAKRGAAHCGKRGAQQNARRQQGKPRLWAQLKHHPQKPLKSKAKVSRAFRKANKLIKISTPSLRSGSIFINLFAFLNVSGLSECFVFRGFFCEKNNGCFFVSIESQASIKNYGCVF